MAYDLYHFNTHDSIQWALNALDGDMGHSHIIFNHIFTPSIILLCGYSN